eukprot:gene16156-biopygen9735
MRRTAGKGAAGIEPRQEAGWAGAGCGVDPRLAGEMRRWPDDGATMARRMRDDGATMVRRWRKEYRWQTDHRDPVTLLALSLLRGGGRHESSPSQVWNLKTLTQTKGKGKGEDKGKCKGKCKRQRQRPKARSRRAKAKANATAQGKSQRKIKGRGKVSLQ